MTSTLVNGLDCSPWQAIRCLRQVADDNAPNEEIRELIYNAFYMDDCYSGGSSIGECREKIQCLIYTLNAGKLPVTKRISNNPAVLQNIDNSQKIKAFLDMDTQPETIKTLGLRFNLKTDEFSFKIRDASSVTYTKRGLLSLTASIYDPLGWL